MAVQLDELISKIKSDQVKQEESKSSEPLTFTTYNSNTNKEKLTAELNGQFVHSQLLIDCLLHIESNPTDMKELVRICRQEYQNDKEELALVQEFQGHYSKNEVVTWYTREAFVYRMLNRALRAQNIHLLFLFRFLIRDLESQLIDNQCQSRITVYRGQLMWAKEFESLKRSSGELISINSYLSTSLNRDLAYKFLRQPTDLERILFEIDADPRLHGIKPFANISQLSCYAKEQEVLFMLGSMFKLGDITHDRNSVWTVKLTLCGDRDLNLKELVEHMKSQDGKEN